MKVCAFSDTHGNYNFEIDACDIVVICGDIMPLNIQSSNLKCEEWVKTFFIPWCEKLPCNKVIFIAGNHDFMLQDKPEVIREMLKNNDKVVYLQDEKFEYEDEEHTVYTIYGTPWCHQFYNWAFMTNDVELSKIYNKIPEGVDLLLTHDCPYGTSDVLLQKVPWNTGKHIGCSPLAVAVDEKQPRFMCCGHLHSCTHEPQKRGKTIVTNVSMLDERYNKVYEPHYFDILEK